MSPYHFYVPYVIPDLNQKVEEIQIDQAVQENRLCIQSLKYGQFKDYVLERVSFVSGEGRMIQTGGYKVRDTFSFGFNITDLFAGSNYTIGLLFEVVVNCFKQKPHTVGKQYTLKLTDASELPQIIINFKEYVQTKEDKEQSLVDGIIISSLNTPGCITVRAFDFSLNHTESIADFQSQVIKGVSGISDQGIRDQELNEQFVAQFEYTSEQNNDVDANIFIVLPLESGFQLLEEYKEAFEKFPFRMHLLKRYIAVKLCFRQDNEEQLEVLDRLTSYVIKKGGTIKASRKVLCLISPWLDKRILGNYNMKIHNGLKQLYDPKDVLNPSAFYYIREKYEKSAL